MQLRRFRYLTAEELPSSDRRCGGSPEDSLCLFADDYLGSLYSGARSELRYKSRGVVLLTHLVRQLQQEITLDSNAGVYLYCAYGPYSLKTQQLALTAPPAQRTSLIEKALPPKDYFIATPAMKAAQISIEFALHGPMMALFSPDHGFDHAFQAGQADLADQVVPAALMAGIFSLDDPAAVPHFLGASRHLSECVFVQYATGPDQVLETRGSAGKFGPLTAIIERNLSHESI